MKLELTLKILEAGNYILEKGMTLERTGKFVTVRPLKVGIKEPRCSDCKYFGHGRATRCGFTTTVCLLQPKNIIDRDGYNLYYHVGLRQMPCGKFEKKEVKNE